MAWPAPVTSHARANRVAPRRLMVAVAGGGPARASPGGTRHPGHARFGPLRGSVPSIPRARAMNNHTPGSLIRPLDASIRGWMPHWRSGNSPLAAPARGTRHHPGVPPPVGAFAALVAGIATPLDCGDLRRQTGLRHVVQHSSGRGDSPMNRAASLFAVVALAIAGFAPAAHALEECRLL